MCNVERRAKSSGVNSSSARTSQKHQQLMQQYFQLVDWQRLKLPSAERRQPNSLNFFERSVEVWADWIRLKKELSTLGDELPAAESFPAKRKEQSLDPTKRDASREEFARRAIARGNMWESLSCLLTLLESFDKKIQRWVQCRCIRRRCSTTGSS